MATKIVRMCKHCNQETDHWDNRDNKRNPKAPDYKCTVCGEAVWPPKKQGYQGKPSMPKTLSAPPTTQKNGKDASIAALALTKAMARANAYTLGKTERAEMLDAVYSDYITFRNRLEAPDAKEMGF